MSDIFMRVLSKELHKKLSQPADHRDPAQTTRRSRRAPLPGCAAEQLRDLRRRIPIRIIDNQCLFRGSSVRPGQTATRSWTCRSLVPVLVDRFRSRRPERRWADSSVSKQKPARFLSVSPPRFPRMFVVHRQPRAGERRRLGAACIQGRRRGGQRRCRRLDADRLDRVAT